MTRPLQDRPAMSPLLPAVLALLAALGLWLLQVIWQAQPNFASGWTVLEMVVILLAYRLRKALPFMRLATVYSWRRVHIVLGLLLLLALLLHIGIVWPATPLEQSLLVLLLLTSVSGLLLMWQAQRLPRLLTEAGGNVLLDAIPQARAQLRLEARQRVLEVAGGAMEPPYRQALAALLPGGGRSTSVDDSDFSIAQRRELNALAQRATQLDTQQRLQRRWRLLLTAHAATSYALLLFALLHLLQAYRLLPT